MMFLTGAKARIAKTAENVTSAASPDLPIGERMACPVRFGCWRTQRARLERLPGGQGRTPAYRDPQAGNYGQIPGSASPRNLCREPIPSHRDSQREPSSSSGREGYQMLALYHGCLRPDAEPPGTQLTDSRDYAEYVGRRLGPLGRAGALLRA